MKTRRYVSEGRVNCPRRGDIDVDVCVVCPELVDVRDEDETFIECHGRARHEFDPLLIIRW